MHLTLLLTLGSLLACGEDDPGVTTEGMNAGECSDAADNDGDGLYDCDDPDCEGAPDCAEDTGGDGGADGGAGDGGEEVERDCNQVSLRGRLSDEEVEFGSFAWYAEGDRNIVYGIVEPDACDHADSLALGGPGEVLAEGVFFEVGGGYTGPFTVGFPDSGMWLDFRINYDVDRSFRAVGGQGVVDSGGDGQDLVVSSFTVADKDGQNLEGAWTACWCPGLAPFLPE